MQCVSKKILYILFFSFNFINIPNLFLTNPINNDLSQPKAEVLKKLKIKQKPITKEDFSISSIMSKKAHWISLDLFLNIITNFSGELLGGSFIDKFLFKDSTKADLRTSAEIKSDLDQDEVKIMLKFFLSDLTPKFVHSFPRYISTKISSEIESEVKLNLIKYVLENPEYEFFLKNSAMSLNSRIDSISNNLAGFSGKMVGTIVTLLKLGLNLQKGLGLKLGWDLNNNIQNIKEKFKCSKSTIIEMVSLFGLSHAASFLNKNYPYANLFVKKDALTSRMNDVLNNVKTVKLYHSEKDELAIIQKELFELELEEKKASLFGAINNFQQNSIFSLMFTGMFWKFIKNDDLSVLQVFNKMNSRYRLFSLINSLPKTIKSLRESYKDLNLSKEALFEFSEEINNDSLLPEINISNGEIIFKDVLFKRKSSDFVLSVKNNVTIKAHEKIGIVGKSGSGKTTLINLILRLFKLDSGKILIDGQDISMHSKISLYKNIAVVSQEAGIFGRSIFDNIHYGSPKATEEEVIEAAKKADIHDFIISLPEGYKTILGATGTILSGGQNQRIGIARAFLKNAPILILDEATSALDSITENKIKESLNELMKGRTTIIIAHRYSTLADVDRILVFENGNVAEQGSHEELLKSGQVYKSLWQAQNKSVI